MDNYAQSSSLTLTPEAFAKSLLSTVGKERETYGALPHFLAVSNFLNMSKMLRSYQQYDVGLQVFI